MKLYSSNTNNIADYILESDAIFDGTGKPPFPGFVAVSRDKIMAVSNCHKEKQRLTGPETVTLPFGGSLIMPGFCESHAHAFYGALELSSANLLTAESELQAAAMIKDYEENPQTGWIFAFGWNHHYWSKKETPTRHSLDRFFPNRPVVAVNEELHALWVNSPALELSGINKDTEIPADMGLIEKDHNGNPTGWLIEEYSDRPGFFGEIYLTAEDFALNAAEFEKEGIRMRLHACGDGAVREALNIIEKARRSKIGPLSSGPCHTVEHIEVIHPDDIPRFQELGAIASVQPDHMWSLVFEEHPFHKILGPNRCRYTYPLRTLADSGAVLAFGSDHPIAELNPLRGIYRAVTRLAEDRKPEGGWNPNEKLTLAHALSAYTYGSAYQMGQETVTGSLEAGKAADITVLDKNLFRVDSEEILGARPVLTMMNGQIYHQCTP